MQDALSKKKTNRCVDGRVRASSERTKGVSKKERIGETRKEKKEKRNRNQILCICEAGYGKPTLSAFVLNLLVSRDGLGGAETFEEALTPASFLGL